MTAFPPASWPAMARFDPEKFVSLLDRFDQLGSTQQRMKVRAEVEEFTQAFQASAAKVLAEESREDSERVVRLVQSRRYLETRCIQQLNQLLDGDLTFTESMRAMRLLDGLIKPRTDEFAQAMEVLAKNTRG